MFKVCQRNFKVATEFMNYFFACSFSKQVSYGLYLSFMFVAISCVTSALSNADDVVAASLLVRLRLLAILFLITRAILRFHRQLRDTFFKVLFLPEGKMDSI